MYHHPVTIVRAALDPMAMLSNPHTLGGESAVDLSRLRPELAERGMTDLLCEGGPQLLGDLVAAGQLDELCHTWVPAMVGGGHTRITAGPGLAAGLSLRLLLEEDGTLLARWFATG